MAAALPKFKHDDYTVGWICALPMELTAAWAMLDIEHEQLRAASLQDGNCYTFGSIGNHNVVIASLPAGKTGKASAATVARDMIRSFKSIRFGLMVGIGGGAPYYSAGSMEAENEGSAEFDSEGRRHIRLGDVVVSLDSKSTEAVVQYDFGKSEQGKGFLRIGGKLNNPPDVILTAVNTLRGKIKASDIPGMLSIASSKNWAIKKKFQYPGLENDKLFKSNVIHQNPPDKKVSCGECSCSGPLDVNLVKRPDRNDSAPEVHYGTIGSADQVMRDAILRDELSQKHKIICFEMEAAGLDSFPCITIRGICDYADSHKDKTWQNYAAATAAAYAKNLLLTIGGQDTVGLSPIEQSKQSPYISLESLGRFRVSNDTAILMIV